MLESKQIDPSVMVALRKESVDRNGQAGEKSYLDNVALRKESVDRNTFFQVCIVTGRVALRKESVDRNSDNP